MPKQLFKVGAKVVDAFGAKTYLIEEVLGEGGYGQAYRAEILTAAGRRQAKGKGTFCLKVTLDPEAWHGESYFGLLTRGLPNVVQHVGSFPVKTRSGMRYFLVLELEHGGTVEDWIKADRGSWSPGQVANAMRTLGRVVGAMHASGAMHRDIKPANVYVGNRKSLRLGDFGIARHGLGGRGPKADVLTPAFVATSLLDGRKEWLPSDDVYQLGLLALTLLLGFVVTDPDWRTLRHAIPDGPLREILQKATGPRSARYLSASTFVDDLEVLRLS